MAVAASFVYLRSSKYDQSDLPVCGLCLPENLKYMSAK